MYARAVDDAGARLRDLRREEWQDLALAGVALVLAIAATQRVPSLALPLFVAGLVSGVRGVRALWRHWDLVDRLAGEPDAYGIAEVRAYASREATMDRRRTFAALIRHHLEMTNATSPAGLGRAAAELAALADELEDETLALDPASAVACSRLLNEPAQSPLLDPALPREDIRSSTRRIRRGFSTRR